MKALHIYTLGVYMEGFSMDLVKKNIHMDHTKVSTITQLSLEEDMNLPENKPDCSQICFRRGWVETEEVKALADEVRISGRLMFCLLYHTEEGGCSLVKLEGKIPFQQFFQDSFQSQSRKP